MSSHLSTPIPTQYPDALGGNVLSVALIGPDESRRKEVAAALTGAHAGAVKVFPAYPGLDDIPKLIEDSYDIIIVDLDSNPEHALELVESICVHGCGTVMVYSSQSDSDLMVRCMRAGAREFLTRPFTPGIMAEALVRAGSRRPVTRVIEKANGKLFTFLGAKGGSGVTTVAINFAVALAQDSGKEVLLIDLNLPLGDAALNLGINAQYSTVDALQNFSRLDANFLSNLLTKHSSGLSVLAAPSHLTQTETSAEAVDKLLSVARQAFDYVVVDLGARLDLIRTAIFADTSTIYMVTQAGIPELRNANRLITEFFTTGGPKLEIVINRSTSRSMGIDEGHITKALTRAPQWKVPGDYVTAKRTQNVATALVLEDSPISRVIRQMAREAAGIQAPTDKKKRFGSLFASKP